MKNRFAAVVTGIFLCVSLLAFQNCSGGFSGKVAGLLSAGPRPLMFRALSLVTARYNFSAGYAPPSSKQGSSDGRLSMSAAELDQRYAKLQSMGAKYRQYNFFWSGFEDSNMASSDAPIACPAGYALVPGNTSDRDALGYHKFRCLRQGAIDLFDSLIARDQAMGAQTGVVLWSAPEQYRYGGCRGMDIGSSHLRDGCVPRDDAMDDYEDFINFAASRYAGGSFGKISHFIVWNENASNQWFDYTPMIDPNALDSDNVEKRIDKLADMMRRVHAALSRHQHQALMYVSTDNLWTPGHAPGHFGSQWLIDGLWARLGVNYSWSVAVHPYGDVQSAPPAGHYSFNNLEMVVQHQLDMLARQGINDPSSYPQSRLLASEQGWGATVTAGQQPDRAYQAKELCYAHNKAMSMAELVAVGHNYFHSTESGEVSGGSSSQGQYFGLIPYSIPNSLDGVENTVTGKAFISTMNEVYWGKRSDHYCCQEYRLGCAPDPASIGDVMGVVDGVATVSGSVVVTGWACMHGSPDSLQVHMYAGGPAGVGAIVGAYMANLASEGAVANACGASGSNYRFSIALDPAAQAANAGKSIYIHGISTVEKSNNLLSDSGKYTIPSYVEPTNTCLVTGGAHKTLSSTAGVTSGQCAATCSSFQSNTYRYCIWGSSTFQQPPATGQCKISGGAGAQLFSSPLSLDDCISKCQDKAATAPYRSCQWIDQIFQAPPQSSRCDIVSDSGAVLKPTFYGTQTDCSTACASFSNQPTRTCTYGGAKIQ